MTDKEVEKLVAVLAARYPRAVWGEDPEATLRAWTWTLADVPYEPAIAEVKQWFLVERFPPDPSEIRDAVLTASGLVPDADTAWNMARDRARCWLQGIGWRNGIEPAPPPAPVITTIAAFGGVQGISEGKINREEFQKAYAVRRKRYAARLDVAAELAARAAAPTIEGGVAVDPASALVARR